MLPPIFLSYARRSSSEQAEALAAVLRRELGHDAVFLDHANLEAGEEFPAALANAVLDARVVVAFVDQVYPERWYCLRELRLALLAPEQLIVALGKDADLNLVPGASTRAWCRAEDISSLVELIRKRLDAHPSPIRDRVPAEARSLFQLTTEEARVPTPLPVLPSVPQAGPIPPSIGDRFVGRADDLARLHFSLSTSAAGATGLTGVVAAAGGFGKTRLAVEYLHRYGTRYYPGGLFWIDATRDEALLDDQFHEALTALRPGEYKPIFDMRAARISVRAELAKAMRGATEPILWVVDGIPEVAAGKPPRALSEFCPFVGGMITVLATSRQRTLDQHIKNVGIRELSSASSVALLQHELTQVGALTPAEWEAMAGRVGHLPLALDLLNRTLHIDGRYRTRFERLCRRSATEELDDQAAVVKANVASEVVRGATETFLMSFKLLDPLAQRCALVLSCLAPAPIPERIMDALPSELGQGAVRAQLQARHWVTNASEGVFGSMHGLLIDLLENQSRDVSLLAVASHSAMTAMDPASCRNPKHWPEMQLCEQHGGLLLRGLLDVLQSATKARADEDVAASANAYFDLANSMNFFLYSQGKYAKSRQLGEVTLVILRKCFGEEDQRTLEAANAVAEAARAAGDSEAAVRGFGSVLPIMERVWGETDERTLTSYGNAALALAELGRLSEAYAIQQRVHIALCEILGGDAELTLVAEANLAMTLHRTGKIEEARQLQQHVFDTRKASLGAGDLATLRAADSLACTVLHLRDLDGCERILSPSLRLACTEPGNDHPDTLRMMTRMGELKFRQGELAEAQALFEEAFRWSLRGNASQTDTAYRAGMLQGVVKARTDRGQAAPVPIDLIEKLDELMSRIAQE